MWQTGQFSQIIDFAVKKCYTLLERGKYEQI